MPGSALNALHVLLHLILVAILRRVLLVLHTDKEAKAQTPSKWQSQNINSVLPELHYRLLGKVSLIDDRHVLKTS